MDSSYDFESVYDNIMNKFNTVVIIAYNPRCSKSSSEDLDEDFNSLCSGGFKLSYWGKEGDYQKFRCPHVTGKINIPHGMTWCSSSNYGYTANSIIKRIHVNSIIYYAEAQS